MTRHPDELDDYDLEEDPICRGCEHDEHYGECARALYAGAFFNGLCHCTVQPREEGER